MSDAPETIWAWTWNTPGIKQHKKRDWVDYPPIFTDWVVRGLPSRKHWLGVPTSYTQTATEYRRADPAPTDDQIKAHPKVKALVDAGEVMAKALRNDCIIPGSARKWGEALAALEDKP